MTPTDEELLHAFYAGDDTAIGQLAGRYNSLLLRLGYLILLNRIGSAVQASGEWDIGERVDNVWRHVLNTRAVTMGRWPHQRLSALTWIIYLLCLEMDRHLGFTGPF